MLHTWTEEDMDCIQRSLGKTIEWIELADDVLRVLFTDQTELRIADRGQSCCERRYMRTDDTLLSYYVGATLLNVELRDVVKDSSSNGDDVHEIQFLAILTDRGVLTISSHNEHNGYYGGFCIRVTNN